jgi:hypothetical protein
MTEARDMGETGRAGWSYCGEAWTDGRGRATVALPPASRRTHAAFAYEVAASDAGVVAELVSELHDGSFVVATDRPHAKVAWRLTELVGHLEPPTSTRAGGTA